MSRVNVTDVGPSVALALAGFADGLYDYRGADRSVVITEISHTRVLARRRIVFRWTIANLDDLRSGQVVGFLFSHRGSVQSNTLQAATETRYG